MINEPPDLAEIAVIKFISKHEGSTVSDIFNGMNKIGTNLSLNATRRILRRLHREKKVTRTGVHAFKYKIKKQSGFTER